MSTANTYYSLDHVNPDRDFSGVTEHRRNMATLQGVVEAAPDSAPAIDHAAVARVEAHLGLIGLVETGAISVLSAMRTALTNRYNSALPNPDIIKPDAIYMNDGRVFVRRQGL